MEREGQNSSEVR